MPPLEVLVYLLCKLFASKLCVSQDGVPLLRPVVTTPKITDDRYKFHRKTFDLSWVSEIGNCRFGALVFRDATQGL